MKKENWLYAFCIGIIGWIVNRLIYQIVPAYILSGFWAGGIIPRIISVLVFIASMSLSYAFCGDLILSRKIKLKYSIIPSLVAGVVRLFIRLPGLAGILVFIALTTLSAYITLIRLIAQPENENRPIKRPFKKWTIIGIIILALWLLSKATFPEADYSGQAYDWGDHYYWNSSTGTVEWTPWK